MRCRYASVVVVAAGLGLWLSPAAAASSEWPLSGYWPMYEGRGQVVHDISGNGNHGRLGSSVSTDGRDADWTTGLYGSARRCASTATTTSRSPTTPRCTSSA